mgnify:CR=1 FL=1|jgi:cysteine dioxygenase
MITSLDQLRQQLPQCSGPEYVKIAQDMKLPLADFEPFMHWDEEHYTRNCIDRTDDYELILLCWEAGQETPIHGHGGEECWVYALQGSIREHRQEWQEAQQVLRTVETSQMEAGDISYMDDNMGYHSLHNVGSGRAMTLHLYMNPIDRCRVFDPQAQSFQIKEMEYDTHQGELLTTG